MASTTGPLHKGDTESVLWMDEGTRKGDCPPCECTELCLGMAEQPGQSEWKWPTEETNSVRSWLPDQEEQVEGALYRQMEASCCGVLVHILGYFHFSVCCRDSTAGHTPSRRPLESTDGSFLTKP